MKHPLWIINSSLLALLILVFGFIFFSQQKVPRRKGLEPEEEIKPIKQYVPKVDISKIYERDLFGTYKKEFPTAEPSVVPPAPPPPTPKTVQVPKAPETKFLDPLPVTLKGIIKLGAEEKNVAIIADNKTNLEASYKVGDKVEDAQLIRIFSNKIVIIRSNGQQEILYLRQQDAKLDPTFLIIDSWDTVVQKLGENNYRIDPKEFVNRIKNISQLIDMLNVTVVYRNGKPVGCRIGKLQPNSFGYEIGLEPGDIIVSIDNIPATDTDNRFKIYKKVTEMGLDDAITVSLQRNNEDIELILVLEAIEKMPAKMADIDQPADQAQEEQITEAEEKERLKILQQKYKFAPTVEQLKREEKRNMMERGKKPITPRSRISESL